MPQKIVPRRISVAEMAPHVHGFGYKENKVNKISNWLVVWIKQSLKNGKIKPGDFLPSKGDLAFHIGVSQGTMQNVFRIVEDLGLVESKQRIGTYIKGNNSEIQKLTSKREQACDYIKRQIVDLKFKIDEMLPSIRKLAENTEFSPATMRTAMGLLIAQGILYKNKNSYFIKSTNFNVNNIKHQNLVDKVAEKIQNYISNSLESGDKLPSNNELSKQLNVSIKTVHDAIKYLSQRGVVVTKRGNYGTFVALGKEGDQYFYEKVESKIRHFITNNYEIGAKLPPIRKFAEELKVSTKTIKKALDNLAEDGYIRFLRGRYGGTFVTDVPESSNEAYTWIALSSDYVPNSEN